MADLLHHQVAGKAVCALDDDRAHAIALDPLEHRGEAGPGVDGVGSAHGRIIEGIDDDEAGLPGKRLDRLSLPSVQVDIVMMRTPDGHGRLELTKFRNPKLVEIEPAIAPPNTLGLRSVMFTVESVDDTVARLRANGAELVGEVAQYEDKYRLCYMRGPAGIIVALAEELF
jgi:catechol 2,3-dioxygenase-like lactoylglutathione lyase family enzyme